MRVVFAGTPEVAVPALDAVAASRHELVGVVTRPDAPSGRGRKLVRAFLHLARGRTVQRVFLEVRPSNRGAIGLYHEEGFNEIGRRPRYYPARDGREDAIVMAIELV